MPPVPSRLQQILKARAVAAEAWEQCWQENTTPWDLGKVTPLITHLVHKGLPNGRCLVPGCGSGYDVIALASPSRLAVGLDISKTALERARKLAQDSPNGKYTQFLDADFFTYSEKPFDLIFDYTFFCALEPSMRPAWATRMSQLLAPDGELITLMFPIDNHEGGPPYAVSPEAYEAVLQPLGFYAWSLENNEFSIEARRGREMVGRWKRKPPKMSKV